MFNSTNRRYNLLKPCIQGICNYCDWLFQSKIQGNHLLNQF